jgi:hypothetical protein
MTPEAQRIAIAEACHVAQWAIDAWLKMKVATTDYQNGKISTDTYQDVMRCLPPEVNLRDWNKLIPDYLNDLNVMHEAEAVLSPMLQGSYAARLVQSLRDQEDMALGDSTGRKWSLNEWGYFALLHSTAAQRAESFLRTIGKLERMTQPELTLGEQLRDEGCAQVLENAHPWSDIAFAALCDFVNAQTGYFTIVDIRKHLDRAGIPTMHPNCIGALMRTARRQGVLVDTGRTVKNSLPSAHARRVPVYERRK